MLSLYDDVDTQKLLAEHLKKKRKQVKLSRKKLAERSTVPEATIRHFETTYQISLRQFLALWLVLDKMDRLVELTNEQPQLPKTIAEVLRG